MKTNTAKLLILGLLLMHSSTLGGEKIKKIK